MAIVKTIKASGGDYTSIYDAIIANTSFSADTDFIISGDITEPGRHVGTILLNGYIVKFYSDLFGRVVYTQNIGGVNFTIDNGSNGELHFSSCILTQELKPTGYYTGAILTVASNTGSGKVIIDSNICKCFNGLGSYGTNDGIYINVSSNKEVQCTNNKVYKSGLRGINLNINSGTGTNLNLENNTVDECNLRNLSYGAGIRINGVTGDNTKLKNNVSTRNLYADFSNNITLPNFQMDNNSDSDGTFNGTTVGISGHNLNSTTIVPANEFLSLDYLEDNYLKINQSSVGLVETGIMPIYALLDITGVTRGVDGTYSRGCYEHVIPLAKMNVLDSNLYIIGKHLDLLEDSANDLLTELFPDTTTLLLRNFEKAFSLSSEGTTQERRNRIISAHRQRGGLSKAYFEAIGNTLGNGLYTVSISEGTELIPFIVAPYSIYTSPKGPATPIPG